MDKQTLRMAWKTAVLSRISVVAAEARLKRVVKETEILRKTLTLAEVRAEKLTRVLAAEVKKAKAGDEDLLTLILKEKPKTKKKA